MVGEAPQISEHSRCVAVLSAISITFCDPVLFRRRAKNAPRARGTAGSPEPLLAYRYPANQRWELPMSSNGSWLEEKETKERSGAAPICRLQVGDSTTAKRGNDGFLAE